MASAHRNSSLLPARVLAMAIAAIVPAGCLGSARTKPMTASPAPLVVATPSAVPTWRIHGVAPVPKTSSVSNLVGAQEKHYRALASRARPCRFAQVESKIHGTTYIGCSAGSVVALDARGDIIASANVQMDGLTSIVPAGRNAIAVSGFNDGAFLRNGLTFLRAKTLRQIGPKLISDNTFLGVIGDHAYIDDWCCFGRPDEYRPATIYSISMKNGAVSTSVDLAPDPKAHPANMQPLGQGEHNYLLGRFLYVVVGRTTYRYDILNLKLRPKRMLTPPSSP